MDFFKIKWAVFIGLACIGTASAQQVPTTLSLKDAVGIALQNNYNIKLSKNTGVIAKNNLTPGNAGMLPLVAASASTSSSILNSQQTRVDAFGNTSLTQTDWAHNNTINYGVNLNWTIFDGFNMFAAYNSLKQLDQYSTISLRDTIESTISNVMLTYYNIVYQTQQIKALQGEIEISRTQLNYTNDKYNVGRASKLDVLNALVNLNTDTSTLLTEVQVFKSLQIRMNQLLVRDLHTDFTINDTISVDGKLILGDIINQAQTSNPDILLAQINKNLAELSLKEVKSTRYPQIGITSGYNFADSKTPAGYPLREQNTNGLNYGLSATVNIFGGFNQWRRERNAKLQIDNAAINIEKTKQTVEAEISNIYISYLSGLDQIKLNQSNVDIAKRNLDISLEKYKLGNITPLEVRQAQTNYLDAQSRFFQAQYQAKTAEVSLKQLTNNINIQ